MLRDIGMILTVHIYCSCIHNFSVHKARFVVVIVIIIVYVKFCKYSIFYYLLVVYFHVNRLL